MAINKLSNKHNTQESHSAEPSASIKNQVQNSLYQKLQSNIQSAKMNAANSDTTLHNNFADKMHQAKEKATYLLTTAKRKLEERRLSFGANNLRTSDTSSPPEHELEDAHRKMYGGKNSLSNLKQAFRRGLRQSIGQITSQEERSDENIKEDLINSNESKVSQITKTSNSNISDSKIDKAIDEMLSKLEKAMGTTNDPTARFLLLSNQENNLDTKQDSKIILGIKRAKNKLIEKYGDKIMAKYNSQDAQDNLRANGKYKQITQFDQLHYNLTNDPSPLGVFETLIVLKNMHKENENPFTLEDWRNHVNLSKKSIESNAQGYDNFTNLKFVKGKKIYKTNRVQSHHQIDLSSGFNQLTLMHQNIVSQIHSFTEYCNKFKQQANKS